MRTIDTGPDGQLIVRDLDSLRPLITQLVEACGLNIAHVVEVRVKDWEVHITSTELDEQGKPLIDRSADQARAVVRTDYFKAV